MLYYQESSRHWDVLLATARFRWVCLALTVVLCFYALAVAFVVLWPTHVDANASGDTVHHLLAAGRAGGWLPSWLTYSVLEWLANVLMFMPGAFLLTLVAGRKFRPWVVVGAVVTTCLIEGIQLFMPGRTSSVLDIAANSLGGLLGWLVGIFVIICVAVRFSRSHGEK